MAHSSLLRNHPFRFLLQALALGAAVGLLVGRAMGVLEWVRGIEVGVVFSLVMWGGFDLIGMPFEGRLARCSPERAGLLSVAWILGVYLGLLALTLWLVRLLVGVNLMANRFALTWSLLVGLATSAVMATKETLTQKLVAERKLAQAEARAAFLALRAQLQPHTLFNALNTIAGLIAEDPARAEEATERLAGLLRRVLGALECPQWTLREEFTLLEDLLRLEQLRFGERLGYRLELEPAMAERLLQPLLLLPLVENALKHGFQPKVGACRLEVIARQGRVRVQDDGVGRDPAAAEGVGLRSVRERLAAEGGELRWLPAAEGCTIEVALG